MKVKITPQRDSWNSYPTEVELVVNPGDDYVELSIDSYTPEGEYCKRELGFSLNELRHLLGYKEST